MPVPSWKLSSELEAQPSDGPAHQPPWGVLLWALSPPAPWPCGLGQGPTEDARDIPWSPLPLNGTGLGR